MNTPASTGKSRPITYAVDDDTVSYQATCPASEAAKPATKWSFQATPLKIQFLCEAPEGPHLIVFEPETK